MKNTLLKLLGIGAVVLGMAGSLHVAAYPGAAEGKGLSGNAPVTPSIVPCDSSYFVGNGATGGQYGVAGTLDDGTGTGSIVARYWVTGDGARHNSGKVPSDRQVKALNGSFVAWSNWGEIGTVGNCLPQEVRNTFLYSIANKGNGQYILMTSGFNPANQTFDLDDVTNGNGPLGPNTETPVAIPALTVGAQSPLGPVLSLSLTWPAMDDLKGFYDVEPASGLITGLAIRFYQSTTAPASFKTADWQLAGVVNFGAEGKDFGNAKVEVPVAPGMNTYVALSVLFDGGQPGGFTETAFVGAATPVPAAGNVVTFTSVAVTAPSKGTTGVRWTAINEGSVAFYQVWGSTSMKGTIRPVSPLVAPAGGSYAVKCLAPWTNYFQVRATMADGSVVASDIVRAD